MCATFVVYHVPNCPEGEWASGIELAPGRFLPAGHFLTESAAAMDAVAMNAALRRNPWLASELCRVLAEIIVSLP
jgi:hypothetical protein